MANKVFIGDVAVFDKELGYDPESPESIESYALKLVNKTFVEILKDKGIRNESVIAAYANAARKGGLGNLLEEVYFGYKANSKQEADFEKAGVELKATPYEVTKKGEKRAGERLVLTMINYDKPVEIDFYKSHAWEKMRLILLIYYLRNKQLESNLLYKIDYVGLFTPPEADLEIIKQDYKYIITMLEAGRAHEISEGDTMYLGACTKGANAEKSIVPQYYGDKTPARKRAFCFKNSYMTYVLENYIVPGVKTYKQSECSQSGSERIITDNSVLKDCTFEEYIVKKINAYKGRSVDSLCEEFDIQTCRSVAGRKARKPREKAPKNINATIAYRILGIKGNDAEEFLKAGITIKTMTLIPTLKGLMPAQHMSFPAVKLKEIAAERWEDNSFGEMLRTTKFLFIVYGYVNGVLCLKGCQFWNMPLRMIESSVKEVWQCAHDLLNEGLQITVEDGKQYNNLPGSTFNRICHLRPHGRNSRDVDILPDGRTISKQCFWLDKKYIVSQLNDELKA